VRRCRLIKQELMLGIILFLLISSLIPSFGQNATEQPYQIISVGDILYVGGNGEGNYSKIQDAINDASSGDTVYVYEDSSPYFEHVVVNKSIKLIGEHKNNTEINGSLLDTSLDTMSVVSNDVTIRGFHITDNQGFYYQAAVKIKGNNTFFSDCIISKNEWIGIYLQDTSFCQIEDCELYENLIAVHLINSRNNTLRNCRCHDNADAISLFYASHNNQLIDCICSGNHFVNIHIQQSMGNQIMGCVCQNGYEGISLAYAPATKMRDNLLMDNYANFGIGSSSVLDFYCDIDTSNTINGKPIYYLIEQNNIVIDETTEIGFLGLVACQNISVKNHYFSNNFEGILLAGITDSAIENCSFYNNDGHGMYLISCRNNTVKSCMFYNSFWDGIFLFDSSNNSIYNCSYQESLAGVNLDYSKHTILQGLAIDNCYVGVSFDSSANNILRDNEMLQCGLQITGGTPAEYRNDVDLSNIVNGKPIYYFINQTNRTIPSNAGQIILINCTDCVVSECNLSEASIGLELAYSARNIIKDNILTNNRIVGIDFDGSENDYNIIRSNLLQGNNYGVDVDSSTMNIFQDNIFIENGMGLSFDTCGENSMIGNIIQGGSYGISLVSSKYNIFTENIIRNVSIFGIYFLSSNHNILDFNVMIHCSIMVYGYDDNEFRNDVDVTNTVNGKPVYYLCSRKWMTIPDDAGEVILVDSEHCIIKDLYLNKGSVGVLLAYSSNNIIKGNVVKNQSMIAIDLGSADNNNNIIQGNLIKENRYGIDLEYSNDNIIRKNTVLSNGCGIFLADTLNTLIWRNSISKNNYGVSATRSNESRIFLNNIYKNYAYGLSAEACNITARWNWWGAVTGPGADGNGDRLHATQKGLIVYTPWLRFPVLFTSTLYFLFKDEYKRDFIDVLFKTLWHTSNEPQQTYAVSFDLFGLKTMYEKKEPVPPKTNIY